MNLIAMDVPIGETIKKNLTALFYYIYRNDNEARTREKSDTVDMPPGPAN